MDQSNLDLLRENEMQYRGDLVLFDQLVEDINDIVFSFGKDEKQDLENALLNFIIQNR